MNKIQKSMVLVAILTLLGSFSVFAAGEGETDDGKILVGFSQIGAESAWRIANTISIQEEAENRDNINLIFTDAQQKQENQIRSLRSFIDQGVDVIAFSPIVESGYGPVLLEAKEAGIPVILTDRAVDLDDESLWVTFMGSDFVLEGERTAHSNSQYTPETT